MIDKSQFRNLPSLLDSYYDHSQKTKGLPPVKNISLKFIILEKGSFKIPPISSEACIVLLSGKVSIRWNSGETTLGPRKNVFTDKASAFYIGVKSPIIVTANSRVELAYCRNKKIINDSNITPYEIQPEQLQLKTVGKGSYKREVVNILGDKLPAHHLLIGETFSDPGMWSSYPPHKHDELNLPKENKMEEIYFYKVKNKKSFGFQRIYSPQKLFDKSISVTENKIVPISFGYHPVSAPPDTSFYYLWVLHGETRKLRYSSVLK